MPLQLRDNLGNRLVLRVESPGTSKIALGEESAERLLGKGHWPCDFPAKTASFSRRFPFLLQSKFVQLLLQLAGPPSADIHQV